MGWMSEPDPAPPTRPRPHSVVCETHGLRYNPQNHDGCARCRRQRGESLGTPAAAPNGSAIASAGSQAGSLGAAIGVALALIAGTGMLFHWDAMRTWEEIQELRQSGSYIEGLTPEQQEQLEQLQRQMEQMLDDTQPADPDAAGQD